MSESKPSASDLATIIEKIASPSIVLVGGMAVDLWRRYYDIATDIPNLTTDVDFFGGRTAVHEAEIALKKDGHKVKSFIATLDDATPNSGKLAIYLEGCSPIEVDFLYRIDNIGPDDIERFSVSIQMGPQSIRVVNPLLLLEMKIGNLAYYPSKRDSAGVDQARIAVIAAGRYLEDSIAQNVAQRLLLGAVERIIRFAARDAGCYAAKVHEIEAMSSITPTVIDACGDDFKTIRYPQATERVKEAQRKFSSMLSRVVAVGHKIEAMRF